MLMTLHIRHNDLRLNIFNDKIGFMLHFLLFCSVSLRCKLIEEPDLCFSLLYARGNFLLIFQLDCT